VDVARVVKEEESGSEETAGEEVTPGTED